MQLFRGVELPATGSTADTAAATTAEETSPQATELSSWQAQNPKKKGSCYHRHCKQQCSIATTTMKTGLHPSRKQLAWPGNVPDAFIHKHAACTHPKQAQAHLLHLLPHSQQHLPLRQPQPQPQQQQQQTTAAATTTTAATTNYCRPTTTSDNSNNNDNCCYHH